MTHPSLFSLLGAVDVALVVLAAAFTLLWRDDRRRARRDTRPDSGLSIVDRDDRDDATVEQVLGLVAAIRAIEPAEDLSAPPAMPLPTPGPLTVASGEWPTIGQRRQAQQPKRPWRPAVPRRFWPGWDESATSMLAEVA